MMHFLYGHLLLHVDGGGLLTGDSLLCQRAILWHLKLTIEFPSQTESDSIYQLIKH